jgi:NAD(P)-dependent dehydrogenase (short-subunit alcohol dehydrogenase family)
MRIRAIIALLALLTISTSTLAQDDAPQPVDPNGKAVLITGASTGIGRVTAEMFAERGFYVYAGARKQADLDALNAIENIEAVKLDVTKQDEIDAAVAQVEAGGRGLYGLINNAGVAVVGPMIEMTDDDLEFQLDVNVFGPFRVTKAFAPLLLESGGRVSTTSSISGFLAWSMGGAYSMSKFAMEAYTDTLAQELEPHGVMVSVINPGNYNSAISKSFVQRMREKGYAAEGSLYEERMNAMISGDGDRSQFKEPYEVAEAFFDAMTNPDPKRRYMVVPNENEARMTLRSMLNRLVQVNNDQPYELTREELILMLDESLENAHR